MSLATELLEWSNRLRKELQALPSTDITRLSAEAVLVEMDRRILKNLNQS